MSPRAPWWLAADLAFDLAAGGREVWACFGRDQPAATAATVEDVVKLARDTGRDVEVESQPAGVLVTLADTRRAK